MENKDLIRRAMDLAKRSEKQGIVTSTCFLSPAERSELQRQKAVLGDSTVIFQGGSPACERQVAFFLPYYLEENTLIVEEMIKAVRIRAFFGVPGHRDYLGAILNLGIDRNRIGDILIFDDCAIVFCLAPVAPVLLSDLQKVGRCSVKTEEVPLSAVPVPEKHVKKLNFTVKSLRLDAVTGELFSLSRTTAAELIRLGAVSLNYSVCEKTDAPVHEGDIISVRGKGKGSVSSIGGRSRKDRLFIEAELWL